MPDRQEPAARHGPNQAPPGSTTPNLALLLELQPYPRLAPTYAPGRRLPPPTVKRLPLQLHPPPTSYADSTLSFTPVIHCAQIVSIRRGPWRSVKLSPRPGHLAVFLKESRTADGRTQDGTPPFARSAAKYSLDLHQRVMRAGGYEPSNPGKLALPALSVLGHTSEMCLVASTERAGRRQTTARLLCAARHQFSP